MYVCPCHLIGCLRLTVQTLPEGTKMKIVILILLSSSALLGCNKGVDSTTGFNLPAGDMVKGEVAFKKYQCSSCHVFEDDDKGKYVDQSIIKELEQPIVLGTSSYSIKNYAQLLTSIINPSHKIAQQAYPLKYATEANGDSKMQIYNDVMTVSELTDIVTFLQPKYKIKTPQYTHYHRY